MRKAKIEKQKHIHQKNLERATCQSLIHHVIICLLIMVITFFGVVDKDMKIPGGIVESQYETIRPQPIPTIQAGAQKDENGTRIIVPINH